MRSIWSTGRSAKSKSPVVVLLTRTPSTSTWIWLEFAPRIWTVVTFPGLPER